MSGGVRRMVLLRKVTSRPMILPVVLYIKQLKVSTFKFIFLFCDCEFSSYSCKSLQFLRLIHECLCLNKSDFSEMICSKNDFLDLS